MLRLKGGIELTEAQISYWDNVPLNAEIEARASRSRETARRLMRQLYRDYQTRQIATVQSLKVGSRERFRELIVRNFGVKSP